MASKHELKRMLESALSKKGMELREASSQEIEKQEAVVKTLKTAAIKSLHAFINNRLAPGISLENDVRFVLSKDSGSYGHMDASKHPITSAYRREVEKLSKLRKAQEDGHKRLKSECESIMNGVSLYGATDHVVAKVRKFCGV